MNTPIFTEILFMAHRFPRSTKMEFSLKNILTRRKMVRLKKESENTMLMIPINSIGRTRLS
ncbi:hypothetical protein [Chryseobacterium arthrosphaerae]|uniref:hypothetical protein n=1 Tax=Chryseobacterium arthrosphaerae TaxID=651561 RepID=UPI000F4E8BDA|nr:hypothetical protein [Chryseobacterium arthrosphaerae]